MRVYVSIPRELRRKIGALCQLHDTTISDLVQAYLEDKVRSHVVSVRSGGIPFLPGNAAPLRLADPSAEPEPGAGPGEREAV